MVDYEDFLTITTLNQTSDVRYISMKEATRGRLIKYIYANSFYYGMGCDTAFIDSAHALHVIGLHFDLVLSSSDIEESE